MRLVVNKNSKYEKNYSSFQMQKQFKKPQNKQTKNCVGETFSVSIIFIPLTFSHSAQPNSVPTHSWTIIYDIIYYLLFLYGDKILNAIVI